MKRNNIIQEKSFDFAVGIIGFCIHLRDRKREYIISNQLLRCGTAIGSNIEEGIGSRTEKDFHFKFSLAYKEARETMFWLKIIRESRYSIPDLTDTLIRDCDEILRILGSILKTLRKKQQRK